MFKTIASTAFLCATVFTASYSPLTTDGYPPNEETRVEWVEGETDPRFWDCLLDQGLTGDPNDNMEALYPTLAQYDHCRPLGM